MTVQVVLAWTLIVLCGVLGYRVAARARRLLGVSPWRIPPALWAMVCVVVPVIGNLVETIALLTTRRPPLQIGPTGRSSRSQGIFGLSSARETDAGAPPRVAPAAGGAADQATTDDRGRPPVLLEAQVGERRLPGPDGWRPAEAGEPSAGYPPLFGWYPDPTGKHELRYWDGRLWGDAVSDGGERTTDPL
jgi:hypothetical protein